MTLVEELRARMVAAAEALKIDRPYSGNVMSDAIAGLDRLTAENERLRDALDQSRIALDDWVNTYAPEFCDAARVEESRARIRQHGTLGYVATVQEQNRRALENSHE